MISIFHPSESKAKAFLEAGKIAPLSYSPVLGTMEAELPGGWRHNSYKANISTAPETWTALKTAIQNFEMFKLGWVSLVPEKPSFEEGTLVATKARVLGFWTLNACRLLKIVDEENRFGFIYGTIEGHMMQGEERFMATRDSKTGNISFEIASYSKSSSFLAWLASYLVVSLQKRFVREGCERMAQLVEDS